MFDGYTSFFRDSDYILDACFAILKLKGSWLEIMDLGIAKWKMDLWITWSAANQKGIINNETCPNVMVG